MLFAFQFHFVRPIENFLDYGHRTHLFLALYIQHDVQLCAPVLFFPNLIQWNPMQWNTIQFNLNQYFVLIKNKFVEKLSWFSIPGGPQRTAIFWTGRPYESVSVFKSFGRCLRNRTLPTSNRPVFLLKLLPALLCSLVRFFSCLNSLEIRKNLIRQWFILFKFVFEFEWVLDLNEFCVESCATYLPKTILSHILSQVKRVRFVDSSDSRSK